MRKKTGSKKLFAILFGIPILLVAPMALLGASVVRNGVVNVEVLEKGEHGTSVEVKIPGAVVPVAMHFLPECVVNDVRCEMDEEARAALAVARGALRALGRSPDGVYVDVRSRDEIVRVEKSGNDLRVYVDTPDEVIRVSIPIRVAGSVLAAI